MGEEQLGVLFLVVRGFEEDGGDVLQSRGAGDRRGERVAIARLAFAGERLEENSWRCGESFSSMDLPPAANSETADASSEMARDREPAQ